MNLSSCKKITLIDIYYHYPNKKNILHASNVVPKPFVKQSECTDNHLSTDWYEWKEVISAYIEKLKQYLEDGNSIELGSKLGAFYLVKLKTTKFVDFKKSKEAGKVIKFTKSSADNYFIMTSWAKGKVSLKLKSFWRIRLNRGWVRSMYKACESDFSKIYKLRDAL